MLMTSTRFCRRSPWVIVPVLAGWITVLIQLVTIPSKASAFIPAWVTPMISRSPFWPIAQGRRDHHSKQRQRAWCPSIPDGPSTDPCPVERKGKLSVNRLFDPKRAIVVEIGDPFGFGDEIPAGFGRDAFDESRDGILGVAVISGRQWIVLAPRSSGRKDKHRENYEPMEGGSVHDQSSFAGSVWRRAVDRPTAPRPKLSCRLADRC